MLENVGKKSKRNSIIFAISFWLTAVGIIIACWNNIRMIFAEPVAIENLTVEDIENCVKVEGSIFAVYDYYAYFEDENGRVTSMDFLIPIGEEEYMGFSCSGETMEVAEQNMDILWEYFDTGEMSEDLEEIQVTGSIVPIEAEYRQYFNEFVNEISVEGWEKDIFLPYTIRPNYFGSFSVTNLLVAITAVLFCVVMGIVFIIKSRTSTVERKIKSYCQNQTDAQYAKQRIMQFYDGGVAVNGFRINDEFFMGINGTTVMFFETNKLAWVYPNIRQQRVNGIPAGKFYGIKAFDINGKTQELVVKNEAAMNEIMDYVQNSVPYIICGYSEEINQLFHRDRNQFAAILQDRKNQFFGQTDMNYGGASERETI